MVSKESEELRTIGHYVLTKVRYEKTRSSRVLKKDSEDYDASIKMAAALCWAHASPL